MPGTTSTINREQRHGLYELVRNHLGSVGDLWSALEHDEDFATAERLGLEFGEDFELLKDIGWAKGDGRDEFDIRMPPHDLMELGLARSEGVGLDELAEEFGDDLRLMGDLGWDGAKVRIGVKNHAAQPSEGFRVIARHAPADRREVGVELGSTSAEAAYALSKALRIKSGNRCEARWRPSSNALAVGEASMSSAALHNTG